MGMFAFKLTFLFCSLTIYTSVDSASVLDNSSDSFGTWLLKEDQEVPSQQSPPLGRRITPKSIFIAPKFDRCESGYKQDQMGQCVKIVRVDEAANEAAKRNALLQMLNSFNWSQNFQSKDAEEEERSTKKQESSTETTIGQNMKKGDVDGISGPLQLSIPFNLTNSSEYLPEEVDTRNNITSTLKNVFLQSTTSENIITENPNEFITESTNTEESTTLPVSEVTFNTNYPESYTTEYGNQPESSTMTLETTMYSDFAVVSDLPVTEVPSNMPPQRFYVNTHYNNGNEGNRKSAAIPKDETTTVVNIIYPSVTDDILKIPRPIKFPQSTIEKHVTKIPPTADTGASFSATVAQNRSQPFSLGNNRFVMSAEYNHNRNENAKDSYNRETSNIKDSNGTTNDNYDNLNISKDSDNSDSSISSSSNIYFSNSESSVSSVNNNSKNDKYQKLPSNGRNKSKCDPASGYDCVKFNAPPPDKAPYSLNRNPVSTYIRFPGMYTKGTSLIRFPSGQKQPTNIDDVISYAEINPGARFWESNRYATPYWPSWDPSKSHFVRIWPDNPMSTYNVGGVNYNGRSQTDNYT